MESGKTNLKAYLDDTHLISAYVSKYYYEGKVPVFRLRDLKLGTMTDLKIQKTYESRQGSYIVYKLKLDFAVKIGEEYDANANTRTLIDTIKKKINPN